VAALIQHAKTLRRHRLADVVLATALYEVLALLYSPAVGPVVRALPSAPPPDAAAWPACPCSWPAWGWAMA
jgi:hypothetical protein